MSTPAAEGNLRARSLEILKRSGPWLEPQDLKRYEKLTEDAVRRAVKKANQGLERVGSSRRYKIKEES